MVKTLKLRNPIMVNGVEISELKHDANEIGVQEFLEASRRIGGETTESGTVKVKEENYAFHIELGFQAILAVTNNVDIEDLKRIKGFDLVNVSDIGLLFLAKTDGGGQQSEISEQPSETIAEPSAPALQTLEECDFPSL